MTENPHITEENPLGFVPMELPEDIEELLPPSIEELRISVKE